MRGSRGMPRAMSPTTGQGGKRILRHGRWQGLGALRNESGVFRLSPWSDPTTSTWIEEPKSPQALNFRHHRTVWKMAFVPMRLKPESGANRIKSADDAYSFMMHMRLSDRNKPHWQMARQALNHAGASDDSEVRAWRSFRAAAAAEGWLLD